MNVEYSKKTDNINIKIETKNNIYKYCVNLNETEDWIDNDIIDEYINNLLNGEKVNKKFLPIPSEDQTVQFIYIAEDIYKKAIDAGIIQ